MDKIKNNQSEYRKPNGIMITAFKSGSGKTMFTCGLIKALTKRGLKVSSFKCGPDYIDPMFHRQVLGVSSHNLDTFMAGEDMAHYLYLEASQNSDISVIEGVMGYYDGVGGNTDRASSYEVAKVTGTPAILVVDAKGASVSLSALIGGVISYRDDSGIQGIILNRVSKDYYTRIADVISKECKVEVLGYLPEMKEAQIGSRHLGLLSPEEVTDFDNRISIIANQIEETVNIERIIELSKTDDEVYKSEIIIPDKLKKAYKFIEDTGLSTLKVKPVIAIAKDEAFSFIYEENVELIEKLGANTVFFSPLEDKEIPVEADALILAGGYPELFADKLSSNTTMMASIKRAYEDGMPIVAECGGFMYLSSSIENENGEEYGMCSVLDGHSKKAGRLKRFGYIEVTFEKAGLFGQKGLKLSGHEFHHWDSDSLGEDAIARKPGTDKEFRCMFYSNTLAAGFEHYYYYGEPVATAEFIKKAAMYGIKRRSHYRWEHMAKPIDSLGKIETMVTDICACLLEEKPDETIKSALVIFAADHGVVKEGVTQTGSEVTRVVANNFAKGKSTVNYMAKEAKTDVFTVDVGIIGEAYPCKAVVTDQVIDRKIREGTGNIAVESAMTKDECIKAVETGISIVKELKNKGYKLIATGEMGIGNTTPTTALAAWYTGMDIDEITGVGAGLSKEGLESKKKVIRKACERLKKLRTNEPYEILCEIGGLEIAAMAGAFIGGMKYAVPVIMDGCISVIAAYIACQIDERVIDYIIPSHLSSEVCTEAILKKLKKEPPLHVDMHLGEGSGAVSLIPIINMGISIYRNMSSFEDIGIDEYVRYN